MIKLLVMYAWPENPEQFKRHYLEVHLPLCRKMPGALRAHYTFEPRKTHGPGRWFCIYEAEYPDEDTLAAALATPEGRAAQADVAHYSPEPPISLIYAIHPA